MTTLVVFMIGLSALGCLVAGYHYAAVDLPAAKLAMQAPTNSGGWGGIQIWSTPGNAYVEIVPTNGGMTSGAWTDNSGSATFSSLVANANYRVTVTKDGYQPYTETVWVSSDSTYVVNANLQPITPATGRLQVYSTPYGGTICVDSGQCQSFYPIDPNSEMSTQFGDLSGDQYHTVTISATGYNPVTQSVYVPAGQMPEVRISLQKL